MRNFPYNRETPQRKARFTSFRKLKVLLLTYDQHIPPEKTKGLDLSKVDWKLEHDVITTLQQMGQDLRVLGVKDDLALIQHTIEDYRPNIVFNLMDEFDGHSIFDQNVVSYLELLKMPYTGCNPRGLIFSRDKSIAKKLLTFHDIPVPKFAVIPKGKKIKRPDGLEFPLFVKSLSEEASLGISQSSIVWDEAKLNERVSFIHESIQTDALIESYIEGRELYVGVWGNGRSEVLPIWELFFKKAPDSLERIATRRVKWNVDYQKKYGISSGPAKNLSEEMVAHVQRICQRAYRVLGLNGYARIDLRLNSKGEIFLLEANPNPHIGMNEDFADSARHAGVTYPEMLWRIMNFGLNWRPTEHRSQAA